MTDSQTKQFLQALQGEAISTDHPLIPFIENLQQAWSTEQLHNKQTHWFWVERITQLVLGELDNPEVEETQAFLRANPTYETFYQQSAKMWELIEEADRLNPLQPLREWREKIVETIQTSTIQPALVWRGSDQVDAPIHLSIPRHGFEILFFLGGIEPDKRYVQGEIMSENEVENWQGTRIWLLSEEQSRWYEAEVEKDGRFLFLHPNHDTATENEPQQQALPMGSYTFEMVWNKDHHLEVHDILIPKG